MRTFGKDFIAYIGFPGTGGETCFALIERIDDGNGIAFSVIARTFLRIRHFDRVQNEFDS